MRACLFSSSVLLLGQALSLHKHAGGPVAHGCAPKHLAGVCRDVMTLWVSNDGVFLQMQGRTGNKENSSGISKPPSGASRVHVEDASFA